MTQSVKASGVRAFTKKNPKFKFILLKVRIYKVGEFGFIN